MEFSEYQEQSKETAIYPPVGDPMAIQTLHATVALGKLIGIIKKIYRDQGGVLSTKKLVEIHQHIKEVTEAVCQISQPSETLRIPPSKVIYPMLGFIDEVAELAEKILLYTSTGDETLIPDIQKEMGDTIWYPSQICTELEISLDEAAQDNLIKLFDRKERGVLGGSGDSR